MASWAERLAEPLPVATGKCAYGARLKVIAGDALPGSNAIVTVSFKIQADYYLHPNRPTFPRAANPVPAAAKAPAVAPKKK